MSAQTKLKNSNTSEKIAERYKQYGRLLSPCAEDAPQKEKILRPECGADAPTFLSAVYKRGTQAKKRQAYAPQYGRSMIEMLGVLAIIGVLTVGSITGYSKAMRRHLLNKQREQISYILSAAKTHRDILDISPTTAYLNPIFKTFGWIPEEMVKENDDRLIYDVFKNGMAIYYNIPSHYIFIQIDIRDNNAFEQCLNLYQTIMPFHDFLWLTEVHEGNAYKNQIYGDKYCKKSNCIKDLTPAKMSQLCQVCKDKNRCDFFVFWK